MTEGPLARVDCPECWVSADVRPTDDRSPSEVVVAHGRASGRELSVTPLED